MDPLRLSYEARLHASQNKRLPLQVVLHALYYDQPAAQRRVPKRRRLRFYLVDMQKVPGNGVKALMPPVSEIATGSKKTTFFSSVSRKLGKLNPFRQGSKDTSSIEESGGVDLTKPRRRRFSLS
ncbi:hypothetical protein HPP92_027248 [Vanilla planifolia]|uniref:NPH3 domain-containing protein n=1 Tax=Vanilla planifolia TaxID=51239 RepID=A0A835U5M3_VANPL|nr:hypothetical protein HPP92_027248 [Vanilla planifolia]